MIAIKLPFGLDENNILVHVSEVERGKKCNCFCPDCGSPLIACKGSKKQSHFKHAVVNECEGGFESAIHLAAKKIISEKKQITLSRFVSSVSAKDSRGKQYNRQETVVSDSTIINFDRVQEEVILHGMKADLIAVKGNTPLIIEIFYRHKVEDQKLEKITKANISAVEINLSDLKSDDIRDWETFWSYINDTERVNWLYNAKAHACNKKLSMQLQKRIDEEEQKYNSEELTRKRKEDWEKRKLSIALDRFEIISSQKSISQYKHEAKEHAFWKTELRYFPYTFETLPNFLNVEVVDGDWIYGCDRRIWQAAFYKSFILYAKFKSFSAKSVDEWLQSKAGLVIDQCIKDVGIYGRRYQDLISQDLHHNLPSSWKTLRKYFNYLEKLGMLEFAGDDRGNIRFRVVNKNHKPTSKTMCQRMLT